MLGSFGVTSQIPCASEAPCVSRLVDGEHLGRKTGMRHSVMSEQSETDDIDGVRYCLGH